VDLLIPAAHAQLQRRFSTSDELDTKALGILAEDAGALALLDAIHDAINGLWTCVARFFPRTFAASND
jgi:hypothetical protein